MADTETNTEKQFGSTTDFERTVLGEEFQPTEEPKEEAPKAEEQPVEEAPKEEPKAEEPKETPKEEPKEEPKAEEPKEEVKETSFDITEINKLFDSEFEDVDSIKEALKSTNRIGELEEQLKELESLKEENLTLRESLDPMKYFSSEDAYRIEQFRKEFPDKVPSVAYKLFTSDLSEMSEQDILAYSEMLEDPDLDYATALQMLDEQYGIEEGEEPSATTKARVRKDARKARNDIASMKSQIKLPDKVDVDSLTAQQKELRVQKQQQLADGWKNVAKEVAKTMPDVVVKDDDGNELFKYSMTQDFPDDVVEQVANTLSQSGIDISEGAAKTAADVMRQNYLAQNFEKILKLAIDDQRNKAEEERLKKQHNAGEPKEEPKPNNTDDDINSKVASKIGGFVPRPFLQ